MTKVKTFVNDFPANAWRTTKIIGITWIIISQIMLGLFFSGYKFQNPIVKDFVSPVVATR